MFGDRAESQAWLNAAFVLEPSSFQDPIVASLARRLGTWIREDGTCRFVTSVIIESTGEEAILATDEPLKVAMWGDRGDGAFSNRLSLEIPSLRGVPIGSTDVLVNVRSNFFARHHDWEYEVRITCGGSPRSDVRVFHKWYGQHQFFVPICELLDGGTIELAAVPTKVGEPRAEPPEFFVSVMLASKDEIQARLAQGAIWLFSTARAGSTWLSSDLLCAGERARPIDESGVGRMFAPLQWDAERFYDLATRAPGYAESGSAFENGGAMRTASFLPPFERQFADMRLENQILSRRNFELYHRLLREAALAHVMNEWGCLDFSRTVFKCPNEAHAADYVMRAFPESAMIFLIRDGRDVMRSRFSAFGSEELAETAHKSLRLHAIAYYSHWWNFQVDIIASAYAAHAPERRVFVKYEDLRRNTEEAAAEIFRGVGLDVTPEELQRLVRETRLENFTDRGSDKPRQNGRVGGFQSVFDHEEIALMNAIMGPNLRKYGYDAG